MTRPTQVVGEVEQRQVVRTDAGVLEQLVERAREDRAGVRPLRRLQDGLVHDGQPIDGTTSLTPRDGPPGELVTAGQRRIEAIRRGNRYAVRVRDPEAPTRTQFGGVPTYAFDPAWAVTGSSNHSTRQER